MDPLSALGLVSAILQVIDFSSKLIAGATHVYSSVSGTTAELEDSDRAVESLKSLTRRLDYHVINGGLSSEDRNLLEVKRRCEQLSRDIQTVVHSTKTGKKGSWRASLGVSLRAMRQKGKLKILEERLDRYRAQAQEYLLATMSDDLSNTNKYLGALTREQAQYSQATRSEILRMKLDITTTIREMQAQQGSGSVPSDPSVLINSIQESLAKLVKAAQVVSQEDVVLQRLWFPELGGRERTVEMPHEQTFRWLLYGEEGRNNKNRNTSCSVPVSRSHDISDSDDEDEAISFRTASDGERRDNPHVSGGEESSTSDRSITPSFVKRSDYDLRAWRAERNWRAQKCESFVNWLRNGEEVFYCSGKAGSGKSTLMKFLAHDKRTLDELACWSQAHGKILIVASFFFWSSGTPLQKRLEGLYREILWDVLRQRPGLIPVVFPTAWPSSPNEAGQSSVRQQPFTINELESAMDRLFLEGAVTSSYRICLFLDGLDEYEGDYWKFAKAIKSWAKSSKDVKFCLSSRPYNAFIRHFASDENKHLNLHELTRADIYTFVSDQFRQDERHTAIERNIRKEFDLLSSIVDRSDGVFLWVRLVTVELLKGMGDNCSINQLTKRLEAIPDGLENMFQRMLDSIDKTDQQRAAQMFLTMACEVLDESSTLVYIQAMLDDLAEDPQLAVPLLSGNIGPYLSPADCIERCHTTGPRAVARCKGLIEVTHSGWEFPRCHQFSFVHRTVGDFFRDPGITSKLKSTAGDFCLYRRLAHAVLACLQSVDPNQALECPDYGSSLYSYPDDTGSTASSSSPSLPDRSNTISFNQMQSFLTIISNAEHDRVQSLAVEVECLISILRQTAEPHDHEGTTNSFPRPLFHGNVKSWYHWGPIPTRYLQSAIISYCMCAEGMKETALELISRDPELLILCPGKHHVFLSMALSDLYGAYCLGHDITGTAMLIKQASPSINADCSERCTIGPEPSGVRGRQSLGLRLTTWGAFLLALSQLIRYVKPRSPSNLAAISTLIELFLQNGADPLVIFIGYRFKTSTTDEGQGKPQGPLYIDLLDMMLFWRLVPTEYTRNILGVARQKERRGWFRRTLGEIPWVGRQTQDYYEKMSPLALDEEINGEFFALSVTPSDSLEFVSWEALRGHADLICEHGSRVVDLCFYV